MTSAADFAKMLPGLDFLQGLMHNAGAALPGLNQWVTPTLDPQELDKRIQDLRTVQFWLEQNARLLATTVQALEVQRLTLSTLRTMNLPLGDLAQALRARVPVPENSAVAASPPDPAPVPAAAPTPVPAAAESDAAGLGSAPPAMVDPVQWWGALTQQFGEIAARALRDGAAPAGPADPCTAEAPLAAGARVATAQPKAAPRPAAKPAARAVARATPAKTARGPARTAGKAAPAKRSARG